MGPAVAAVAERLGLPLMPWQRQVADIGLELDPATNLPAYREVIVTCPRQSGKTTAILAWELHRALAWGGPQRIVYSAQTGADARKKLIEDQLPILEPRRAKLGIRRFILSNGHEGVEFQNGSRIVLLASGEKSGHGKTVDLAIKDELFADVDHRRDQSLIPAMTTRAAAQILTFSTAGTVDSVALNQAVERGRAAVNAGQREGIAYFEWSADSDDDPDDPATWWSCMPALGFTTTERVIAHARQTMSDDEFRRAFLNQQTKAEARVVPASVWAAVCAPESRPTGPLVFAVDVNPERSAASIVAASGGPAPVGELVECRPGTSWVVDRARDINAKHGPGRWVLDGVGPAVSLKADLERAGLVVQATSAKEMVEACGWAYDAFAGRTVAVRSHPRLDDAVAAAAKRRVGDSWAWARRNTSADVCPLVALTLALWAAAGPAEEAIPNVW